MCWELAASAGSRRDEVGACGHVGVSVGPGASAVSTWCGVSCPGNHGTVAGVVPASPAFVGLNPVGARRVWRGACVIDGSVERTTITGNWCGDAREADAVGIMMYRV